jgi:hypothetical protein
MFSFILGNLDYFGGREIMGGVRGKGDGDGDEDD